MQFIKYCNTRLDVRTHDELLPREVNIVDGPADDDRSLPYGGNVRVAGVREKDGRVCTMHDELQGDVVLQIQIFARLGWILIG